VAHLSGGMRRRLTIARALINQPDIVLLDEPTTGLDPQARHDLWDRLYQLRRQGVTLVITTHYMDEAEQLCDRLVIVDQGRIVAHGPPRDLIAEHASRSVVEVRHDGDETVRKIIHDLTLPGGPDPGAGHADRRIHDDVNGRATAVRAQDPAGVSAPLAAGVERVEVLPDRALVYTADGDATAEGLHVAGIATHRLHVRRGTLEDVFLRLSGRSLVE
jgi:lipooligosaccharide transport system ATP-binding protein